MINESEITYGRRIDLLVTTDLEEGDVGQEDIKLCSIEFKRINETEAVMRYQQNKNIRINSCILNETSLLTQKTFEPTVYLDFS